LLHVQEALLVGVERVIHNVGLHAERWLTRTLVETAAIRLPMHQRLRRRLATLAPDWLWLLHEILILTVVIVVLVRCWFVLWGLIGWCVLGCGWGLLLRLLFIRWLLMLGSSSASEVLVLNSLLISFRLRHGAIVVLFVIVQVLRVLVSILMGWLIVIEGLVWNLLHGLWCRLLLLRLLWRKIIVVVGHSRRLETAQADVCQFLTALLRMRAV
jgi:hypothetical protein